MKERRASQLADFGQRWLADFRHISLQGIVNPTPIAAKSLNFAMLQVVAILALKLLYK